MTALPCCYRLSAIFSVLCWALLCVSGSAQEFPTPPGLAGQPLAANVRQLAELTHSGKLDAARELADAIESNAEESSAVWEVLGFFHRQDRNRHRAARCYERAVQYLPPGSDPAPLCRDLIKLYDELRNPVAAAACAKIMYEGTRDNRVRHQAQDDVRRLEQELAKRRYAPLAAEIRELHATPRPGTVTIDGKLDDWDLSGEAIACNDVRIDFNVYRAAIALMYDARHLYVAIHYRDWTPMEARISSRREYSRGWDCDSVQMRFEMSDKLSNLDCWYYRDDHESVIYRQHGGLGGQPVGQGPIRLYRGQDAELEDGLAQAFRKDADEKGYIQELRVPWEIITEKAAPKAGDKFHMLFQLGWGERHRDQQIVTCVRNGVRIHDGLWQDPESYGPVILEPKGRLNLPKADWQTAREQDLEQLWEQVAHQQPVRSVVFTPDGKSLLTAGLDGTIRQWTVRDGREEAGLPDSKTVINALAVSPDGTWLAAAGEDRDIHLYDLATRRGTGRLVGHEKAVWDLVVTRDGKRLVSGGLDGTVRIWNRQQQKQEAVFTCPRGIRAVALDPAERLLAGGGLDAKAYIWDLETKKLQSTLAGSHRFGIRSLAFTPDGQHLLTGADDMLIFLWDLKTGTVSRRFAGHASLVTGLCFAPDGKQFLSSAMDGWLRVWDVGSGKVRFQRQANENGIWAIAMSPDGRTIAAAGRDQVLRLLKAGNDSQP